MFFILKTCHVANHKKNSKAKQKRLFIKSGLYGYFGMGQNDSIPGHASSAVAEHAGKIGKTGSKCGSLLKNKLHIMS